MALLQLINNSSSLEKEHRDRDGVWISDLNKHKSRFFFSVFSLDLVSTELIYEALKSLTTFANISKFVKDTQLRACRLSCRCSEMWSSTVFRVWYIIYIVSSVRTAIYTRYLTHYSDWEAARLFQSSVSTHFYPVTGTKLWCHIVLNWSHKL